jgi:integral membrane sensor domain MASE1
MSSLAALRLSVSGLLVGPGVSGVAVAVAVVTIDADGDDPGGALLAWLGEAEGCEGCAPHAARPAAAEP